MVTVFGVLMKYTSFSTPTARRIVRRSRVKRLSILACAASALSPCTKRSMSASGHIVWLMYCARVRFGSTLTSY